MFTEPRTRISNEKQGKILIWKEKPAGKIERAVTLVMP